MVSCIKIETASLTFACLSMLTTSISFLWCGTSLVRFYISMTSLINTSEKKLAADITAGITTYGLYINLTLAILLSILAVALAFSIVLTKGLLSKNSHLVKAYFIYGVTGNTFSALFGILLTVTVNVKTGLVILLGCFVYSLILMMIKNTYLKLATNDHNDHNNQCCPKDVVAEEKTISIKL